MPFSSPSTTRRLGDSVSCHEEDAALLRDPIECFDCDEQFYVGPAGAIQHHCRCDLGQCHRCREGRLCEAHYDRSGDPADLAVDWRLMEIRPRRARVQQVACGAVIGAEMLAFCECL